MAFTTTADAAFGGTPIATHNVIVWMMGASAAKVGIDIGIGLDTRIAAGTHNSFDIILAGKYFNCMMLVRDAIGPSVELRSVSVQDVEPPSA